MGKVQTSTTAKGAILKRKEIVIIDDTKSKVKKFNLIEFLYLNDLITFRYHLYYGILHKLTILKGLS